jgi:LppP/LprE lipoprotein
MRRTISLSLAGLVTLLSFVVSFSAAAQDASWLDGDLTSWNKAGMELPKAPDVDGNPDPRCAEKERPAETDADKALIAKGWKLLAAYQSGWDVTVVSALAGYDGMCRPWAYNSFVFVGDTFAGTISPVPMDSRTDGASSNVTLWYKNEITAEYERYAETDAACCPSNTSEVTFTIEDSADGPVLNPVKS